MKVKVLKGVFVIVSVFFAALFSFLLTELYAREGSFIVKDGEIVIVAKGDQIDRLIDQNGEYWSVPLVEKRYHYNNSTHGTKPIAYQAMTQDGRTVKIEYQFNWRIGDPEKFYRTYRDQYPYEMKSIMPTYKNAIEYQLKANLVNYQAAALSPHTGYAQYFESGFKAMFENTAAEAKKRVGLEDDGITITRVSLNITSL